MSVFFVYVFAIATGFVAAGLMGSFYQLVTNRQMTFELFEMNRIQLLFGIMILTLAGPAVIMRNAIRARLIERRPGHWLALSTAISAAWSLLSGVFILNIYLALRSSGHI